MRCYDFVLASMYRYSWLITFEIFRNFVWDRGVGGWGVSYPYLFEFVYIFFYIYMAPYAYMLVFVTGLSASHVLPTSATPRPRDSTSDVKVLIPRACLQLIDAEHFAELDKTK